MTIDDYLDFLSTEYLERFTSLGGSTVKFVVCGAEQDRVSFVDGLASAAAEQNFVHATINAAVTRVSMMHEVFATVAARVDWRSLARAHVMRCFRRLDMLLPADGSDVTVESVALTNDYHVGELRRELNRELQKSVFQDYAMAPEFRMAMMRLCQAQADPSADHLAAAALALRWVLMETKYVSELRSLPIYQRIARHNARFMLYSLAHWVQKVGKAGLVLGIDIGRLTHPASDPRSGGIHYTKLALLDAYEVLRQLVDSTDRLPGTLITVAGGQGFLTDDARGLAAYQALRLRVWDDVRDRQRSNPFSTLVRLTPGVSCRAAG